MAASAKINQCRSCGHSKLHLIISLGQMPLANALLTAEMFDQPEPYFPLDLMICPHCSLVQISETVAPEDLFRNYLYFSSFSDGMLRHAESIVKKVIQARKLDEQCLAMEIASNDGYLLQFYRNQNIPVLGIEPAVNIACVAEERGIPTVSEFFDEALAHTLRAKGQVADVIHANNVLAHVADLNSFVAGIGVLLKPNGLAVIEVPYVKDLLDNVEFDTIYHEHLCYYSLTALDHLFRAHRMLLTDVERIPIHGGSLRIFVQHPEGHIPTPRIAQFLAEEAAWGVGHFASYASFKAKVEQLKWNLLSMLQTLKQEGRSIAVYGASAKGSTLLNYLGLDRQTIDFVVDRSTVKQGFYTPGTHIQILAPEALLTLQPDYVLLLSWNFVDEILDQQAEYRKRGGRFIVPLPQLKIV